MSDTDDWPGNVVIELRVLADDVPALPRIRRALRTLLRAYRLRAVVVGSAESLEAFYTRRAEARGASR
jgi:hypothetical protein